MNDALLNRRIALLVDAENIKPEYMRQVFPHVFKLGRPVLQFAYGDFSNPCLKNWVDFLRRNLIEARQVTPAVSGKNAADIALVVDAMALVLEGKCDSLCLVSSDRDFVSLTTFLKGRGVDVYGFGGDSTDRKFRQSCAKFFELKDEPAQAEPKPQKTSGEAVSASALRSVVGQPPAGAKSWPKVMQELLRLQGSDRWVSLQTLGCALGKLGVRAKDNGGANWAKVFEAATGFEMSKDATGRRSVRFISLEKVA
ncbi:NYN domain-containing protein [Novosphingobium jiangmenense]|uniref:NYN domain-containing protein n=1 Tax=Novosphingobium jiangmenense TaxID=2791981 RepID=A0ABS0HCT4_9SPHN|nr:NYN domain-containing protein [Novosphingobium jiangmenense]MBF9150076.1 NYN domain-containing protein [Novosphingobium jiangmenense]